MFRPTRPVLAFLLLSGLVACGESGSDGAELRDPAALDAPDRYLDWAPEPVFAVGGMDAPEWATFGSVGSVGFDDAGHLYVFDRQTSQVTVVGPGGEFLRTVGRQGGGPGELSSPQSMAVTGDGRVVLSDLGKRGLVVYDGQGEWLGNVVLDLTQEGLPTRGMVAADGRVTSPEPLRMFMSSSGEDADVRITRPETRPVWLYPTEPGAEAVLAWEAWNPPPPPEGGESSLESEGAAGQVQFVMGRLQAFTPELHLAVLPGGRIAVADTVTYTIRVVSPEEGLAGVLERPIPPTEVTPEVQEMERARRLDEIVVGAAQVRIMGGPGVAVNPDAMRRMLEDQVANMAFFPEIPVVEGLAADRDGRIWVQRSSGTPGEDGPTDLLSPDGRYLGTLAPEDLRIPDAFGPEGLAAYIETDEFDVATVRVVRLPRAS